jgi:hypothetical protein
MALGYILIIPFNLIASCKKSYQKDKIYEVFQKYGEQNNGYLFEYLFTRKISQINSIKNTKNLPINQATSYFLKQYTNIFA